MYAYEEKSPITVYRKYQTAFKYDERVDNIAEYIEYILEIVPENKMLHLAAGLVYNKKGDDILAKDHLDKFFEVYEDDKIKRYLSRNKYTKYLPTDNIRIKN